MDIFDLTAAQTVINNLESSSVNLVTSMHRLTVMTQSGAFFTWSAVISRFLLTMFITQPEVVMLFAESLTQLIGCSAYCNGMRSSATWSIKSKFSMPWSRLPLKFLSNYGIPWLQHLVINHLACRVNNRESLACILPMLNSEHSCYSKNVQRFVMRFCQGTKSVDSTISELMHFQLSSRCQRVLVCFQRFKMFYNMVLKTFKNLSYKQSGYHYQMTVSMAVLNEISMIFLRLHVRWDITVRYLGNSLSNA